MILAHIWQKNNNSLSQQIEYFIRPIKQFVLVNCWPSGKYVNLLYMYSILGRGSFCFNYCLNSAWHGGDQFMALLRWYGSPGFFDSGLQLISIFGLLFLIFLLTIPHRFSMGFRSGEFAGQSSTPTPWSFNQLLVLLAVWVGAKYCWKMKSASLKSWSAEGSMKCFKISWYTGEVTLVFKKHKDQQQQMTLHTKSSQTVET